MIAERDKIAKFAKIIKISKIDKIVKIDKTAKIVKIRWLVNWPRVPKLSSLQYCHLWQVCAPHIQYCQHC